MELKPDDNLLVCLHRWAKGQDENFITEAFAHLLRHLQDSEPTVAIRILGKLTNGHLRLSAKQLPGLRIIPQSQVESGKPDLELTTPHDLIYVEAKVKAPVRASQLSKYRADLKRSGVANTALVLLTRYRPKLPSGKRRPDSCCRWYEVADWLATELEQGAIQGVIGIHITEQFIGLLKARNITMDRVSDQLPGGMRACMEFMKLLREVIASLGYKPTKRVGTDARYIGYAFKAKTLKVRVGLSYKKWNAIRLETSSRGITAAAAKQAGLGKIEKSGPTRLKWVYQTPFEQGNFFALSPGKQMEWIEEHLKSGLEGAAKIKL